MWYLCLNLIYFEALRKLTALFLQSSLYYLRSKLNCHYPSEQWLTTLWALHLSGLSLNIESWIRDLKHFVYYDISSFWFKMKFSSHKIIICPKLSESIACRFLGPSQYVLFMTCNAGASLSLVKNWVCFHWLLRLLKLHISSI